MMQVKLDKDVYAILKLVFKEDSKIEEFVNKVLMGVITGKLVPIDEIEELTRRMNKKMKELERQIQELRKSIVELLYNQYYDEETDWYYNFN